MPDQTEAFDALEAIDILAVETNQLVVKLPKSIPQLGEKTALINPSVGGYEILIDHTD